MKHCISERLFVFVGQRQAAALLKRMEDCAELVSESTVMSPPRVSVCTIRALCWLECQRRLSMCLKFPILQ